MYTLDIGPYDSDQHIRFNYAMYSIVNNGLFYTVCETRNNVEKKNH